MIYSSFKQQELNPGDILQTYSQGLFIVLNKIVYKHSVIIYWLNPDQTVIKVEYER